MKLSLSKIFNLRSTKESQVFSPRRGFSYSSNIIVSEETAMKVSAFYRGVMYISTQIAKLPWNVKDKGNNIVDDDVAFLLSTMPNPEMNSFRFRLLMVQTAIIKGNFYAEIERNTLGRPVAIWPLEAESVQLYRLEDGRLTYKCIGADQSTVYMRPQDIFHVANFHLTRDGLTGQGLVAYATESLGISIGANAMAKGIVSNAGVPSGVISVTGSLSTEAAKRLAESWNEAHGGRKTGGTAVLEDGAKYEPITFQPDVLQFLESRKFSVIEIARFLNIPPIKLYDIDANSYNTQEQSNLEVATDTIHPWATNIQMEADIKILNKKFGGRKSEFDLYDLFKGDMKTRSSYFKDMISIAGISPNEIRSKEGQTAHPNGNDYYIASNNLTPINRIDEVIDAQVAKGKAPGNEGNTTAGGVNALEIAATKFLEGK